MAENLGPVNPDEPVTRFLFDKRHFIYSEKEKIVLGAAFLPYKNQEPSVARVIDLDENTIWKLGEDEVRKSRQETIKARADLKASDAKSVELEIIATPKFYPRHASIINWPEDEAKQNLLAGRLAAKAAPVPKPKAT